MSGHFPMLPLQPSPSVVFPQMTSQPAMRLAANPQALSRRPRGRIANIPYLPLKHDAVRWETLRRAPEVFVVVTTDYLPAPAPPSTTMPESITITAEPATTTPTADVPVTQPAPLPHVRPDVQKLDPLQRPIRPPLAPLPPVPPDYF